MFRRLVAIDQNQGETWQQRADKLFRAHPSELAALLEAAWKFRKWEESQEPGHPDRRSDIPELPTYLLEIFRDAFEEADLGLFQTTDERPRAIFRWDHLIYAYLIENTGIFEIFRKVLHEYRYGEKLGPLSDASIHWLRNTEELFFRDPAPFSIYSVVSYVRPDVVVSRNNAYERMFGMPLNFPTGAKTLPAGVEKDVFNLVHADRLKAGNLDGTVRNGTFFETLEEFLREIWVGIENAGNSSGSNPTDDAAIASLAQRLFEMLRERRKYGNLSQEEFFFVSTMAWFHLSIEYDSPIVKALRAQSSESQVERLKTIASRVGFPLRNNAFQLLRLADPLSALLIQIETGTYNDIAAVKALYTPGPVEVAVKSIINDLSSSTGRSLKKRPYTAQQ